MLRSTAMGGPSGAFCLLLSTWLAFTYLASTAGGHYVESTLDCLTPAVLAQAAAALLYSINISFRNGQKHALEQQNHVARRAWVLALGLLHLMSSTLTLASFGLSTVSHTYIIRTLEPILSCGMIYVIHGRKRDLTEVALLAVVAGATACGVLAGQQPVQQVLLSTDDSDALSPTLISSYSLSGQFIPVALALVATCVISCRSVTSKAVAALTGTAEFDTFLEASVPGLLTGLVLQALLWSLFGVQPLQGLHSAAVPSASLAALLVCGASQCAYNAASFKILQQYSSVMHGMLNVLKRVFIIAGCALMMGTPLSAWQLLGVAVANAAAAAFALRQAAAAPCTVGKSNEAATAVAGDAGERSCECKHAREKGKAAGLGLGRTPSAQALGRLVYIVGATLLVSALFLAYVLAALQSQHQIPPSKQHQQLQPQLLQVQQQLHPRLLNPQLQLQLRQSAASSSSAAEATAASNPEAAWSQGILQATTGQQQYEGGGLGGPSINRSARGLSEAVQRYLVRDFGRLQCLTALHEASKASLAPFLQNRTTGGVALYDVALHKNLGDAVLWAAAAKLVPSFHESVKYVCAQSQFPGKGAEARKHFPKCNVKAMLKAIGPNGVVLLAPGGNWGDLWWFVHSQRLGYLREMTEAAATSGMPLKVVQLPQSLTFNSTDRIAEDARVINAMPPGMLTLFARQQTSLQYARQHYSNTTVLPVPDLAFSLGPLMAGEAKFDILFLMRKDKEAQKNESPLINFKQQKVHKEGPGTLSSAPTSGLRRKQAQPVAGTGQGSLKAQAGSNSSRSSSTDGDASGVDQVLQQLEAQGLTYTIREWEYTHENYTKEVSRVALVQLAESRLQGAIDIISLGKVVVTNRLHAAVMANLVGRPLVWIDTQHKKLSGVRSLAWSYSSSCSERNMHSVQAGNFKEAAGIAVQWLQSPDFIWSTKHLQLPQLRRRI